MPAITIEIAQAQLDAWLAASLAVAGNKSYTIAGRQMTRENGSEIREQIAFWRAEVDRLSGESLAAQPARLRLRRSVFGRE